MRLAIGAALLTGCILPVSTGTPMPATTLGQGRFGGAISGEAPTLDLLADGDDYSDLRGAAPAAAMTMTLSYGIGDNTDIEVSGEGALYFFIIPLPTGGSIGVRQHLLSSELFDVGIAGKVGGVSSNVSSDDSSGNSTTSSASAVYGAVQGIVALKEGIIRPMAALNVMPFRIRRDPSDEAEYRFRGLATSATVGLMATFDSIQVGPYFTITNFVSERFNGGWFPSGGLMLAVRPDRSIRRRQPVMPVTPYYPPAPAPAPAPAPPYNPPYQPPYAPPNPTPPPS